MRNCRLLSYLLLALTIGAPHGAWAQSSVSGVNTLGTTLPIGADQQVVMTVYDNGTNGYVGIGTTVPGYKLDVTGDINLSAGSYLRQNGGTALITSAAPGYNTFVGQSAGTPGLLSGGTLNTALGFGSLQSGTTAQNSTAVGVNALAVSRAGNANTAVGENALINSTSSYNTAIGASTGASITSGSQNIVIGFGIDVPVAAGVGQINIGNAIYATGATGTGVTPAGNVGIGIVSPAAPLDVNGGMRGNNSGTVAGSACSPEGMIAYDMTNHQPIYCSSGSVWTNVNSSAGFMGRTWHCVSDGHAVNGTVWGISTNNNGYPMEISGYNGQCTSGLQVYINGTPMLQCNNTEGYQDWCSYDITVPVGATFQVVAQAACGGYYCALY